MTSSSGDTRTPLSSSSTDCSAALPPAPGGRAQVRPAMKLVISVDDDPWTGTIYPTQTHRGGRRAFRTPEDLLEAIAALTGWQGASNGGRPRGAEPLSG